MDVVTAMDKIQSGIVKTLVLKITLYFGIMFYTMYVLMNNTGLHTLINSFVIKHNETPIITPIKA